MSESLFPPGTPVCVKQSVQRREGTYEVEIVGVVEAWEESPTGSWHAFGRSPNLQSGQAGRVHLDAPGDAGGQKLWLKRLKLRKASGELVLLVIDDSTEIAKLTAKTS